jgi:hypothetical protein
LFVASLLGVVLTVIHTFNLAGSTTALKAGEIAGYILMPLGVAGLLTWCSKQAERKNWIH